MSSIKKGDEFELCVYEIVDVMLKNETFIIKPHTYQVHRKKKYYSSARKSYIEIDISVECFMQGVDKPILYIFIECKDYNKSIPVDDIEEFHSKVGQISGVNAKAIFVTKSALQRSALEYSISKNIAVWRVLPEDNIEIVIGYITKHSIKNKNVTNYINVFNALTDDNFKSNRQMFCLNGTKYYTEMEKLFSDIIAEVN